MNFLSRFGIGTRLAIALAGIAVTAVALATLLSNIGLNSRLDDFARDRLNTAAQHTAELGADLYLKEGSWRPQAISDLTHLVELSGYRPYLTDARGRPLNTSQPPGDPSASASVLVSGEKVGRVTVSPVSGQVLTSEDRSLHDRLNSVHLVAAGLAIGLGLVAALFMARALAQPLRRITLAAESIQAGDLNTRVAISGAPELRQLGHVLNRLATTLQEEENIRRSVAADLAHELRTPLGGIVSRIEAAQDDVMADRQRNLEAMHSEALRLSQLIEDIGHLAEAQQPGLTIKKTILHLNSLANERANEFAAQFATKGIALEREIYSARVLGDPGRIAQIIDNLLSNALRYTDTGGTVTLSTFDRDKGSVLKVSDTGIGIKGDDLPFIFERFWRGERSRARATGGAGIGLAIVEDLVRAHEGHINVDSTPGKGSRFTVTFPPAS